MKFIFIGITAIFAYLAYSKEFEDIYLNIALGGFIVASVASLFVKTEILQTS